MRLCDRDIEAWLDEGRLSINPRPPVERINGATVDVRLGNKFRTFRGHTAAYIDLSGPKDEVSAALGVKLAQPQSEVYSLVGDGSFMMLHSELVTSLQERGLQPILLVAPQVRPALRKLTERSFPNLVILSWNEIAPKVNVNSVGMVSF